MSTSEQSSALAGPGRIVLSAAQPGVEFVVRDDALATVASGVGRLDVSVPPGLYQIGLRAGDAWRDEVVLVPPGGAVTRGRVRLPLPTVAPVTASSTASADFRARAERASARARARAGQATVVVAAVRPVELLDSNLAPVRGMVVPPGGYLLRTTGAAGSGDPLYLPLWLPADWQTLVFHVDGALSVHLTPADRPWRAGDPVHTAVETALAGLPRGHAVFGGGVPDDLALNPMLGIITALTMRPAAPHFDAIVTRLRDLLPAHPDVVALSMWRSGSPIADAPGVSWPPLFLAAYRDLLLPADRTNARAIAAGSLAEQVAPHLRVRGPWLSWTPPPGDLPAASALEPGALPHPRALQRVRRFLVQAAAVEERQLTDVTANWLTEDVAQGVGLPVRTVESALTLLTRMPGGSAERAGTPAARRYRLLMPDSQTRRELKLTGDRVLSVELSGDPQGVPVVLHHGTPGSGTGPKPRSFVLYRLGIRLVSYSRPGYGRSTRSPGRTVADAARDVEFIADELGLEQFAVLGRSGGGPHALACAALLPDRITKAATLVSVAPADAIGRDWYGHMVDSTVVTHEAPDIDEPRLIEQLRLRADRVRSDPSYLIERLRAELTPADLRIVDDLAIRRLLLLTYDDAVADGPHGWIDDVLALRADWGFDLGRIRAPVRLWHGADDQFTPVRHTRWLAEHIPTATVQVQHGATHFGALQVVPQLLSWLTTP